MQEGMGASEGRTMGKTGIMVVGALLALVGVFVVLKDLANGLVGSF